MRFTKYAILAGCAFFLTGSNCFAAGNSSEPVESSAIQPPLVAGKIDQQQIRPWLNRIKPAAGITTERTPGVIKRKEYWQQTVVRSRPRSRMTE